MGSVSASSSLGGLQSNLPPAGASSATITGLKSSQISIEAATSSNAQVVEYQARLAHTIQQLEASQEELSRLRQQLSEAKQRTAEVESKWRESDRLLVETERRAQAAARESQAQIENRESTKTAMEMKEALAEIKQLRQQLSASKSNEDKMSKLQAKTSSTAKELEEKLKIASDQVMELHQTHSQTLSQNQGDKDVRLQDALQSLRTQHDGVVQHLESIKLRMKQDQDEHNLALHSLQLLVSRAREEKERAVSDKVISSDRLNEEMNKVQRLMRENARLTEERNQLRNVSHVDLQTSEKQIKLATSELVSLETQLEARTTQLLALEKQHKSASAEFQELRQALEHKLAREISLRSRVELELKHKTQKVVLMKKSLDAQEHDLKGKISKLHQALASSNETIRTLRSRLALRPSSPTRSPEHNPSQVSLSAASKGGQLSSNLTSLTSKTTVSPLLTNKSFEKSPSTSPTRLHSTAGGTGSTNAVARRIAFGGSDIYEDKASGASILRKSLEATGYHGSETSSNRSKGTTSPRSGDSQPQKARSRLDERKVLPRDNRPSSRASEGQVVYSSPWSIRKTGIAVASEEIALGGTVTDRGGLGPKRSRAVGGSGNRETEAFSAAAIGNPRKFSELAGLTAEDSTVAFINEARWNLEKLGRIAQEGQAENLRKIKRFEEQESLRASDKLDSVIKLQDMDLYDN